MPPSSYARLGALASVLTLAACAGGGGAPRPDPQLSAPPPLFISPAGEPFRRRGGQGDPLADWFQAADADRDGRLVRGEFVADAARFFTRLDADGNGRIDGVENNRYEREIAPEIIGERLRPDGGASEERPSRGGPPDGGPPRGGPRPGGPGGQGGRGGGDGSALLGAMPYGMAGEPQPVRAADSDISQSVSEAEFTAHAERLFARLDPDGDGAIVLSDAVAERSRIAASARGQGGRQDGARPGGGPPGGGRRRWG